jgi:hypothetical protein
MAITLGTPSATAQSATYTAPFNSFLGAFEGRAGNGTIQELRILWVRTTVAGGRSEQTGLSSILHRPH